VYMNVVRGNVSLVIGYLMDLWLSRVVKYSRRDDVAGSVRAFV
jgi:hypothetical protein